MKNLPKKLNPADFGVICVVGPTASGKSELAVKLAKKYGGEIISADSRQIYKGMDIGSGKVLGSWQLLTTIAKNKKQSNKSSPGNDDAKKIFVYKNIAHYLIDEASPRVQYSAARFQRRARAAMADIIKRGKIPIICGGTGHWIDAAIFDNNFPEVKPDAKVRAMLSHLTTAEMFEMLKKLDPVRGAEIDKNNPHRLIRALEIVISTGKPVPKLSNNPAKQDDPARKTFKNYKVLWLGLSPDQSTLEKNIAKRLKARLKIGMLKEVDKLHLPTSKGGFGLSWKKLETFGLEYKYCALLLQGKITFEEMENGILIASRQYAKRQMTWWKRNTHIHWFDSSKNIA